MTGPATGGQWVKTGAVLLLLAGITQVAYGAAAIGGIAALEDNVREIESDPRYGELYLSLAAWGLLLVMAAIGELFAAWRLARRARGARLAGLGAALLGLAVAFFTLALFHLAALVTVALLLAALYVLSYRVNG